MADYKSIRFTVDFELGENVLGIVNDYLAKQPEPRPFVAPNSSGYVFYFHTLDVRLLRKNIEALKSLYFLPKAMLCWIISIALG